MEAKLFIFAAVAISEVFSACSPKGTRFKNFQKKPKRSYPFVIDVVTSGCTGLYDFYYGWKVEEIEAKKRVVQTSTKKTINIDGYKFDSEYCFKTAYMVTVEVSHFADMSFADKISSSFHFTPDFMHIEITGGYKKPHRVGEDLTIDAKTHSRDTSYPPNEESLEDNIVTWKIEPSIKDFPLPSKGYVLYIPNKYLKLGDVYHISISVKRVKIPEFVNVQYAVQVVSIVPKATPELKIKCVRNCIMPLSWESSAFILECFGNCRNMTYRWAVNPEISDTQMEFGTGYDKFIINDGAYDDGDTIFVTCFANNIEIVVSLTFVSGIVTGNCKVSPSRGVSAVTKFEISCESFESPYGLSRCIIYQGVEDNDEYDRLILDEFSYKTDTELFLPPGNPIKLTIIMEDHAFLQAEVTVKVLVEQYRPTENIPIKSSVKMQTLSLDSPSIVKYSIEGFYNEVVQMINCVLWSIKTADLDRATIMDLHKHMVEAVHRLHTARFSSAIQRLLLLLAIEKYRVAGDSVTTRLVGEALMGTAMDVHSMYAHVESTPVPHYYVYLIFDISLQLSSSLLRLDFRILDTLTNDLPPHYYDSYEEFESQKAQIRNDYRSVINNIIISLQTNCITSLVKALPDETSHTLETHMINIRTERKLLSTIENNTMIVAFYNNTKSRVILPPDLIEDFLKKYQYIDYQFAVFLRNPFWWHEDFPIFNTHATLFDLFLNCEKIQKITKPFYIYLDIIAVPHKVMEGTLTTKNVEGYRIELTAHVTLVLEFFNEGKHPNDYSVTWSECFCTEEDFLSKNSRVIRKELSLTGRTMRVENDKGTRIIYICVKKLTPIVTYRFTSTTFSCMYWSLKEKEWKKGGCKVIEPYIKATRTMLCQCHHLSVFIGEILAPPTTNVINKEIDFKIDFNRNYVMVAVIGGMVFLWLLFLLLAHMRDKTMKKENVIHKLDDNVPGDSNPYLIVVFTGIFYDAQTTADVAFQIIGDKAQSRAHVIKCHGVTLLKRNSQDWFMLYTPNYLGQIKKIKIWHNCKGRYPHWYCDRIIVQDLKIGEQYCFTVKKWFSVIWGSGKIYRELRLKEPGTKISNIYFRTQLEHDLRDEHLWLSVVTRDFQSNFNSKERVSTGFCFLFLSMLASALLYGLPKNTPSDSIDQQSDFSIVIFNVLISIESWIIATPMSYLIYFIFKNSAPL